MVWRFEARSGEPAVAPAMAESKKEAYGVISNFRWF
jgi:hypothetical protein